MTTVFEQMTNHIINHNDTPLKANSGFIDLEDYDLWLKDVIWDCLHGIRYGQSFCNRFGITDNLLYYTTWPTEQIDEYIKKTYIARS